MGGDDGDEQDVRGNREEGRLGEGDSKQRRERLAGVGPANGPIVEPTQEATGGSQDCSQQGVSLVLRMTAAAPWVSTVYDTTD